MATPLDTVAPPDLTVGLGTGLIAAQIGSGSSATLSAKTAFPGVLRLRIMKRDGSGLTDAPDGNPDHAGTVQETEIGDPTSSDYDAQSPEIVHLQIQAVNPFQPTDPPQKTNAIVGIAEIRNTNYDHDSQSDQFYAGKNGSTMLDTTGAITPPGPGENPSYLTMTGGTATTSLTLVADARVANDGTIAPIAPGGYVGPGGAQLQPVPAFDPLGASNPTLPIAGEIFPVNVWVDERGYSRPRESNGAWSAGANAVRDWMEKKAWDCLGGQADSTGELTAAVAGLGGPAGIPAPLTEDDCVTEGSLQATGQAAHVDPLGAHTIVFNPYAPSTRHEPQRSAVLHYFGFRSESPLGAYFQQLCLHEVRHSWQFLLSTTNQGSYPDFDGHFLLAFPRASSPELADSGRIEEGGLNPDGKYCGDTCYDISAASPKSWSSVFERNSMRFTSANGLATLTCGIASIEIVSGDNQHGAPGQTLANPLVVRVSMFSSDSRSTAPLPGAIVKFSVDPASGAFIGPSTSAYIRTDDSGEAAIAVTAGESNFSVSAVIMPWVSPLPLTCALNDPSMSPVTYTVLVP